jgi:hypothetical protein
VEDIARHQCNGDAAEIDARSRGRLVRDRRLSRTRSVIDAVLFRDPELFR